MPCNAFAHANDVPFAPPSHQANFGEFKDAIIHTKGGGNSVPSSALGAVVQVGNRSPKG
jgi:hypothetical protein